MKNLAKTLLLYIFVPISLGLSDSNNKNIIKTEPKFLDGVNSKNPEAQQKIDQLKKDFYNERESIHQSYEDKIKSIKKARKENISELKKKYRKKLRRLRKKYPDIPYMEIDSKPKPKPVPPRAEKNNKKAKMRDQNKDKIVPKKLKLKDK